MLLAHQLLLETGPTKTPPAAEKFFVECIKHIPGNDSSDSHILIASKCHSSIIRSISLDGNMHPVAYTLYIRDSINNLKNHHLH